jgi:hypothetical protein
MMIELVAQIEDSIDERQVQASFGTVVELGEDALEIEVAEVRGPFLPSGRRPEPRNLSLKSPPIRDRPATDRLD